MGARPVKCSICLQYFSVSVTGFLGFCSLIRQIQCRREDCTISIEHLLQNKEQNRGLAKALKLVRRFLTKALFSIKMFHKYTMNRKYWTQIIYKQTNKTPSKSQWWETDSSCIQVSGNFAKHFQGNLDFICLMRGQSWTTKDNSLNTVDMRNDKWKSGKPIHWCHIYRCYSGNRARIRSLIDSSQLWSLKASVGVLSSNSHKSATHMIIGNTVCNLSRLPLWDGFFQSVYSKSWWADVKNRDRSTSHTSGNPLKINPQEHSVAVHATQPCRLLHLCNSSCSKQSCTTSNACGMQSWKILKHLNCY